MRLVRKFSHLSRGLACIPQELQLFVSTQFLSPSPLFFATACKVTINNPRKSLLMLFYANLLFFHSLGCELSNDRVARTSALVSVSLSKSATKSKDQNHYCILSKSALLLLEMPYFLDGSCIFVHLDITNGKCLTFVL